MAIIRPVTKTLISTSQWGIPITDEVNRLTTAQQSGLPTPWVNLTLINGWTNYGAGYSLASYRKVGDIVYIRGLVNGSNSGTPICSPLPAGFRRSGNGQFASDSGGAHALVGCNSDGSINHVVGGIAAVTIDYSFSITP